MRLIFTVLCAFSLLYVQIVSATSLEPVDGISIPDGAYNAKFIRDIGNVTQIEFSGNFDYDESQPNATYAARAVAAKEFYRTHTDEYDYLIFFTDFDYEMPEGVGAFYSGARNDIEGINQPIFDQSKDFGSNSKLRGLISMRSLSELSLNPLEKSYQDTQATLAHELMHCWVRGVHFKDELGNIQSSFIGQKDSHWSALLDSNGSVMYGQDWINSGTEKYTALPKKLAYSPLDLYLAGFYQANEVPDMTLLESDDISASDVYLFGQTISASAKTVSIEQIIAAEGARTPNATDSQKKFNVAFVLLTQSADLPLAKNIVELNNLKESFEQTFSQMTGGRGVLNVFSNAFDNNAEDALDPINLNNIDMDLALSWLQDKQSVLGYWGDRKNTRVKDTAMVTALLSDLVVDYNPASALRWLAGIDELNNVDDAARILKYNPLALAYLVAARDSENGWGILASHRQSILDTAVVLNNVPRLSNDNILNKLLTLQNQDGGWPLALAGKSHPTTTAQVIKALLSIGVNKADVFDKAAAFLAANQTANGSFNVESLSSINETAIILSALSRINKLSKIDLNGAIGFLERNQLTNGSWKDSIYTSANVIDVLQSIQLANLKISSATVNQVNIVEGDVINVSVEVVNVGAVVSSATTVSLSIVKTFPNNDITIIEKDIPELGANEGRVFNFSFDTSGYDGKKRLKLLIDPDNKLLEKTKVDNSSFVDVLIGEPAQEIDLAIKGDILFNPQGINILPSQLTTQFTVANLGLSDANDATVLVSLGDDSTALKEIFSQNVTVGGRSNQLINVPVQIEDTRYSHLHFNVVVNSSGDLDARPENNAYSVQIPYIQSADYSISPADIAYQSSTPVINEDILFSVKIRNLGTSGASPATASYNIKDGTVFEELGLFSVSLNPGEFVEHQLQWRPTKSGVYQFNSIIDGENLVVEVNESNNQVSVDINVLPIEGMNLSVNYRDLAALANELYEGKNTELSVVVVNNGAQSTPPTNVKYFIGNPNNNGQEIGEVMVPVIASGESYLAKYTWNNINYSGNQNLFVKLDSENELAEIKENDNEAFIELDIIPKADLALSDSNIEISPNLVLVGEMVELKLSVLNLGGQMVGNYNVDVMVENNLLTQISGSQMLPYSKQELSFSFAAYEGLNNQSITITVDLLNDIDELNELNNTASTSIAVTGGEFYLTERYISPNGDGIQDQVGIYYNFDNEQIIEISILDDSGTAIKVVDMDGYSGHLIWSGKNDLGYLVNDGEYLIQVKSKSSNELLADANITVDNNRSSINDAIGSEYGELINVSDKVGYIGQEFYFDNDQKMVFLGDGEELPRGLYVANFDGSDSRLISSVITGDILTVVNGLVVTGGNYGEGYIFEDIKVARIDTGEIYDFDEIEFDIPDGGDFYDNARYYKFVAAYAETGESLRLLLEYSFWESFEAPVMIVEVPLNNLSDASVIDKMDIDESVNVSKGFIVPGTPLAYVARENGAAYANLQTGKIYTFPFNAINFDVNTKEIIGVLDNNIVISDYFGNVKNTIPVSFNDISHILYDGVRKEAVVYEESGGFMGCGSGFILDETASKYGPGGVYRVAFEQNTIEKISSRLRPFYKECLFKVGIPPYQSLPVQYDALLIVDGAPLSLFDKYPSHIGLLDNGLFIDNAGYILKERVTGTSFENAGYDQSTSLILHDFTNNSVDNAESLFNQIGIDNLYATPDRQFLVLKTREENADYTRGAKLKTSLFRSLMNLSVGLSLQSKNNASHVEITATAADKSFEKYDIQYRLLGELDWAVMLPARNETVVSKVVHSWIPPSEGVYTVKLTAFDKAGNTNEVFKNIAWGRSLPVTSIAIDKELFSPNGDGVKDSLSITYSVNRATNLEIQIYSQDQNLIREEFIDYAEASAHAEFKWDGRDQFGQSVGDGVYEIHVEGLTFTAAIDSTYPVVNDQCTSTLMNPDSGSGPYFDTSLCVEVSEDNVESIGLYLKSNSQSEWRGPIELKADENGYYRFNGDFFTLDDVSSEFKVDVIDKAGNKTSHLLDVTKKIGYFRFYGAGYYFKIDTQTTADEKYFYHNFDDVTSGNNTEDVAINIEEFSRGFFLNNIAPENDVHFEISLDKENWETLFLGMGSYFPYMNPKRFPKRQVSFAAYAGPSGSSGFLEGKFIRAVAEIDGKTIFSNSASFYNEKSVKTVTVSLIEELDTKIELNFFRKTFITGNGSSSGTPNEISVSGEIEASIFSQEDLRYLTPIKIYSEFLESSQHSIKTEAVVLEPCTAYVVSTTVNGEALDDKGFRTSCLTVSLGVLPNLLAGCGELSNTLDVRASVGTGTAFPVTSLTASLMVNGEDKGYVYSELNPITYDFKNYPKEQIPPYNKFPLDISGFEVTDNVVLEFQVVSADGEEKSSSVRVNLDNQLPLFTNTNTNFNTRQCAVTLDGKQYVKVEGQVVDYTGNDNFNSSRSTFFAAALEGGNASVQGLSTYSSNENYGLLNGFCEYDSEFCTKYAPKVGANLIEVEGQASVLLQQGYLELIPVASSPLISTLHVLDQNGNHSCTSINVDVDYEIENLRTAITGLTSIDGSYMLSLQSVSSIENFISIAADESLDVTVSIHDKIGGAKVASVFEGAYQDGELFVPYNDIQLNDGHYEIVIKATDSCGIFEYIKYSLIVDSTSPEVQLISPQAGVILHGNVDFFGSITDTYFKKYTLELAIGESSEFVELHTATSIVVNDKIYSWNVSNLAGKVTYRITAEDLVGNLGVFQGEANIDNGIILLSYFEIANRHISLHAESAPSIPAILQASRPVDVKFHMGDKLIYSTSIDSGLTAIQIPKVDIDTLSDGLHEITAVVSESNSPSITEHSSLILNFDSTLPLVESKIPESEPYLPGQAYFDWSDENLEMFSIELLDESNNSLHKESSGQSDAKLFDIPEIYPGILEAYYTFAMTAQDKAGNTSILSQSLLYDRTVPTISLLDPIDKYINHKERSLNTSVELVDNFISHFEVNIADKAVFQLELSESSVLTEAFNLSGFTDGLHSMSFALFDKAGNSVETLQDIIFDSVPPALLTEKLTTTLNATDKIEISLNEENIDSVAVSLNGTELKTTYRSTEFSLNWPIRLEDGSYELEIISIDLAKNTSKDTVTITRDSQPPLAPANLEYRKLESGYIELYWLPSVSDDVVAYQVYRDGALLNTTENITYIDENQVSGVYEYWVKAIDAVGNVSGLTNSVKVIIDNTPPSITVHSLSNAQEVFGIIPITISIPDNDLKQFTISVISSGSTETNLVTGNLPIINQVVANLDTQPMNGSITLKVVAEDVSGNHAELEVTFVVNNALPKAPVISASLTGNIVTLQVTQLDANASGFEIYRNEQLVDEVAQITLTSWTDTLSIDGIFHYYVVQKSTSGLSSQPSNSEQIFLDLTDPQFNIINPQPSEQVEKVIELNLDIIDKDIARFDIALLNITDGSTLVTQSETDIRAQILINIEGVPYADYRLDVTAFDLSGNSTLKSVALSVADITPPLAVLAPTWLADGSQLTISWDYDASLAISEGVELFGIALLDSDDDYINYQDVAADARETVFTVEEGEYRVELYVLDTVYNESLPSRLDDIEIIKPSVSVPYTPDTKSSNSITITSSFMGDVWIEKNGEVLQTYEVNYGDVIDYSLNLDSGVNNYIIYGHYDNNTTLDFELELINSDVPSLTGPAVFDSTTNSITLTQPWESDFHSYLVAENDVYLESTVDGVSSTDSRLTDKNTNSRVYYYDYVNLAELTLGEERLINSIDISFINSTYSAGSVSISAWSGMHWINIADTVPVENIDFNIQLDKPYLTDKILIELTKVTQQQYGISVSEIEISAIDGFASNILDISAHEFSNQNAQVFVANQYGIVSDAGINVSDIKESLTAPELSGSLSNSDITLNLIVDSEATSTHVYRNNVDIAVLDPSDSTFIDLALVNGSFSYYAVSYDDNGNRSAKSNVFDITIAQTLPQSPYELTAEVLGENVELKWQGVTAGELYQIYRKTTLSNSWDSLQQVSALTFTDKNALKGTPYMYAVTALDSIGNESHKSNFVTAIILDDAEFSAPVIISPQNNETAKGQVQLIIGSTNAKYLDVNRNDENIEVYPVNDEFSLVPNTYIQSYIEYPRDFKWYVTTQLNLTEHITGRVLTQLSSRPDHVSWDDDYIYLVTYYGIKKVDQNTGVISNISIDFYYNYIYGFTNSSKENVIAFNSYSNGLWVMDLKNNLSHMVRSGNRNSFDFNVTSLSETGEYIAYVYGGKLGVSHKSTSGSYEDVVLVDFDYEQIADLFWNNNKLVVIHSLQSQTLISTIDPELGIVTSENMELSNVKKVGKSNGINFISGYTQDNNLIVNAYDSSLNLIWQKPSILNGEKLRLGSDGYLCNQSSYYLECALLPGYTAILADLLPGEENVFSAYAVSAGARYSAESNKVNVLAENILFVDALLAGSYSMEDDDTLLELKYDINMQAGFIDEQTVRVTVITENGDIIFESETSLGSMSETDVITVTESVLIDKDVTYYAVAKLLASDHDSTNNQVSHKVFVSSNVNPSIDVTYLDEMIIVSANNIDKFSGLNVILMASTANSESSFEWQTSADSLFRESVAIETLAMMGEIQLVAKLLDGKQQIDESELSINYQSPVDVTSLITADELITSGSMNVRVTLTAQQTADFVSGSYILTIKDMDDNVIDSKVGNVTWLAEGESQIIDQSFDLSSLSNGSYQIVFEFKDLNGSILDSNQFVFNKEVFSLDVKLENNQVSVPVGTVVEIPFNVSGEWVSYISNMSLEFINEQNEVVAQFPIESLPLSNKAYFDGLSSVQELTGQVKFNYQVDLANNTRQETLDIALYQISVLDVTAPIIEGVTPANHGYVRDNQNIVVAVSDSDNSQVIVEFTQNNTTTSVDALNNLALIPFSSLAYGENALSFRAIDEYGNKAERFDYHVIFDNVSPQISINSSSLGLFNPSDVTISSGAIDDYLKAITVTLNDQLIDTSPVTINTDGFYRYIVNAVDLAGNESTKVHEFNIDSTKPLIETQGLVNGVVTNQDIEYSVVITDANLDTSVFTIDGNESALVGTLSDEGIYSIYISATDKAALNETINFLIEIDKTAPDAPVLEYTSGHIFDDAVINVRGTAEIGSTVMLQFEGMGHQALVDNNGQFVVENIALKEGINELQVSATDRAGNASEVALYNYQRQELLQVEGTLAVIEEPRVLLYTHNHPDQNIELEGILNEAGIVVKAVADQDGLMSSIRSMKFNILMVADVNGFSGLISHLSLAESLEIRSYIANGLNLVLLDNHLSLFDLWSDILGIHFHSVPFNAAGYNVDSELFGHSELNENLIAYNIQPLAGAYPFGQTPCSGFALKCKLLGETPALIVNKYGLGTSVMFSFNTLQYLSNTGELIIRIVNYVADSNSENFEYKLMGLMATSPAGNEGSQTELTEISDRVKLELLVINNGSINNGSSELVVDKTLELSGLVQRSDLNATTALEGSVYLDGVLKSTVQSELFKVILWGNLLQKSLTEVQSIDVPWYETIQYLKLRFTLEQLSESCDVSDCDVIALRKQIYVALAIWRVHYSQNIDVLKALGQQLMYLDYIDRQQEGGL